MLRCVPGCRVGLKAVAIYALGQFKQHGAIEYTVLFTSQEGLQDSANDPCASLPVKYNTLCHDAMNTDVLRDVLRDVMNLIQEARD